MRVTVVVPESLFVIFIRSKIQSIEPTKKPGEGLFFLELLGVHKVAGTINLFIHAHVFVPPAFDVHLELGTSQEVDADNIETSLHAS